LVLAFPWVQLMVKRSSVVLTPTRLPKNRQRKDVGLVLRRPRSSPLKYKIWDFTPVTVSISKVANVLDISNTFSRKFYSKNVSIHVVTLKRISGPEETYSCDFFNLLLRFCQVLQNGQGLDYTKRQPLGFYQSRQKLSLLIQSHSSQYLQWVFALHKAISKTWFWIG
jgi:hypothetical protein